MKAGRKNIILLIQLVTTLFLSSCGVFERPGKLTPLPEPEQQAPQSGAIEKRFIESTSQGPTAVESAIELSQKYARVSEEAGRLRLKSQDLAVENRGLKQQVATLETQLQQAQEELYEANNLLREMLVELNNWKADVIGFRHEMRGAEKAQLEALLQILKVLGGETKTDSQEVDKVTAAAEPKAEPFHPQPQ
ncbi:MAG: hypothetical protein ACYS4W_00050 [Planctomycetota bacterium]